MVDASATCPSCGTSNPAGTKFCSECGTRLVLACTTCGAAILPGGKFCGECGTRVGAEPWAGRPPAGAATPASTADAGITALSATPQPVAERRLVSVLFADLVGFTPFAEERDAEEVREALSRYFDIAREVVERYGGSVEKFIGDAVMAVWGAPVAHEDDAERAVRAALELVDAVRALGPSMSARAGVLTGEAAVTLGAVGQGMVAGDLVNTAARLQSVAPPGSVLVGEATQRAAAGAIAFEPVGDQELKGKAAPVPAWRAMRVVAGLRGRDRSSSLEAPFVGRDDEFRLLKDLFHATGRDRRVRLVSVIGPAGIGKSRLAWEFSKYLDGLVEDTYWHTGRSPAYGNGITFWALGEMVRRRAGLAETDDEATTRAKVAASTAEWIPDEAERRWVEPALLALLGLEQGVGSEQLFGAWRTWFERIAAKGNVALVFEDLHWADPGTLDFIDHMLEWSKGLPIFILTLARPELLETRPDWGAGKRNFVSLTLEPLTPAAMRQLLTGLVPGLPEPALRDIVSRADGIPLYAVEMVRTLLADGRLVEEDGRFRPVGDLTGLAVPDTLTALIGARLDALEPVQRSLLQDAAVLGQSFTVAGLSAVSGTPEPALEPLLRDLVRREILTLDVDPRSPERGQYAWMQALSREVAYGTLAKRDRKVRHLAAARFFEGLGTDELAGALATHYLAAYQNAPEGDEAEALAGQARIALRAAAERARALGGHAQAVTFLRLALSVTDDPADEADLLEGIGDAAASIERYEEAETAIRQALERREALGDRVLIARTTASLGRILLHAYRFDAGLAVLEEAAPGFRDLARDPALIGYEGQLARAYFLNEQHAKAVEVADRVLADAEHADLTDIVADTLVTRGSALCALGRRHEGIGAIEAGRKLADAQAAHNTVARALNNLASFLSDSDPRESLRAAREGMQLAERLGWHSFNLRSNAFSGAFQTGDWPWAIAITEASLAQDMDPLMRAAAVSDLLGTAAARGEPVDGALGELETLVGAMEGELARSPLTWARAAVLLAAGRDREAHDAFRKAGEQFPMGELESVFQATRAALWAGDAELAGRGLADAEANARRGRVVDTQRLVLRAGVAALEGRAREALAMYREGLRSWRDLGVVWEEALTGTDMAILLDPAEPEARDAAENAREIYQRLAARPYLERLEAALARAPVARGEAPSGAASRADQAGKELGARTG
jgi:class 3 adenylate cyclase